MGPSDPNEAISEFPTSRYIVGRLAPARENDDDMHGAVDPTENDSLGAGDDDDEAGPDEGGPPLIIGFNPSSIGLSFTLAPGEDTLEVRVTWGDYKRERDEAEGVTVWQRYPRETTVSGIPVASHGRLPEVSLLQTTAPPGITVMGFEDREVSLSGVVHAIDSTRAVSLFLVNRRPRGALTDRNKDERWLMQPRLEVRSATHAPAFQAKSSEGDTSILEDDDEVAINRLLYRHVKEFATGHGVAAGWDDCHHPE